MPHTQQELDDAMRVVESAISRCEKIQPKFQPGTAQHALLKNRLRALRTAQRLLSGEAGGIPKEELEAALPPFASILRKTEAKEAPCGLPGVQTLLPHHPGDGAGERSAGTGGRLNTASTVSGIAGLTISRPSCTIDARGKQTVAWAGRKAVHEESPGSTGQG